jgi:predicted dehydrogenase/aryl-alcohol dehydrogenase-like predicted oxidoreductase
MRWGILGPGAVARDFQRGVADSANGRLVAIGARDPQRPGLADAFPGARILSGYQALLDDADVEAVYISTPHPVHAEWAIKAAEAGKHVLVEKPLALSAFEADAVLHAHRKAGTFAGEAFMYRVHPLTARLGEIVASGAIGEVRMIKSSFGFAMPQVMPEHRLYANDLAGGGILDVGGYPVSMARYLAGACEGKPFLDPVKVVGAAHLGETGVDEWAAAVLQFANGILAEVACSVSLKQDNVLRILGTGGRIEVADFWFAGGKPGGTSRIVIDRNDDRVETIEIVSTRSLYSFEVDAAGEAIRDGRQEFAPPGMTWADTLGNAAALDKWRAASGLEYEIEKPQRRRHTLSGRPLKPDGRSISRRALAGLPKPVSVVGLGFEDFRTFASGAILLDAYFEAGGNLFDTAFVYGAGYTEKLFGDWHTSRGVRAQTVLIAKGAHTPLCYPDVISKQLAQSLERLQTDYVDIYFMHRDNPEVPVGEFVDAMDAEAAKGRIRGMFGGSNWTRARIDAANDYAARTGKRGIGAISNNFSLAEMQEVIWQGCVSSSDDAWKAWLEARQLPNFAWSSQGRGFFTDLAGRDKRDNTELVRVWYSGKNFERRDRAVALARELGKEPIHVALAYVLAQPFPVIPLIGPRTLRELDHSVKALDICLTPEQVRWLEGPRKDASRPTMGSAYAPP